MAASQQSLALLFLPLEGMALDGKVVNYHAMISESRI